MKQLIKYGFLFCILCLCQPHSYGQDTAFISDEYAVDSLQTSATDSEEQYNEESNSDTFKAANRTINSDAWTILENDSVFNYKNEKEAEIEIKKPVAKKESWFEKVFMTLFNFIGSDAGQVLFWIIIFCALAYIIYRIFKGDISLIFGRKEHIKTSEISTALTKEDLTNADWEAKLNKALQDGDTRLATRFAFVSVLQLLHKNLHINYRINTTNFEYYTTIKQEDLKPLFRQLLLRYEFAWFGQFGVSNIEWTETMRLYDQIKSKL